jgi:uncharacterized protein (DUF433 family)
MATDTKTTRTEHPHIVRREGVCGGRPTIEGSRISVDNLALWLKEGYTPADMTEAYPHVTPAAIYDALSYYYDHKKWFDDFLAESTPEKLAEKYGFRWENGRAVFDKTR